MTYLETLAGQAHWATGNILHNLDFVPENQLNWKPAPTANSALEIINHIAGAFKGMTPMFTGGDFGSSDFPPATNAAEARQLLLDVTRDYVQALKAIKPEDLEKTMELPFGTFTLARLVSFPVIDLIHHHGQIAYIQTLLGDTESHFEPAGMQS